MGNYNFEEKFNILDVAQLLGFKVIHSNDYDWTIECPYCGSPKANVCYRKNGKDINGFNCYGCGQKGNLYTIYVDAMGIREDIKNGKTANQVARREILERLNLNGSNNYKPISNRVSTKTVKERPDKEKDIVNKAFLKELKLNKENYENLIKRGLSKKDILSYGFRTVEGKNQIEVCRRMQSKGINPSTISGFFKTSGGDFTVNTRNKQGFLCPVISVEGYLVGFQIRVNNPKNGQKYIWLSSNNKPEGISSGSPCGYYGPKKAEEVYVVDGILKALICHCICEDKTIGFLGTPGVSNYKNIEPAIMKLKKMVGIKKVWNAYDMDEFTNPICRHDYKTKKCDECDYYLCSFHLENCTNKIKKIKMLTDGSKKLQQIAKKYGLEYERKLWNIDEITKKWKQNVKGLDDMLLISEIKNPKYIK